MVMTFRPLTREEYAPASSGIERGLGLGYLPAHLANEQQKERLVNALQQINLEYAPQAEQAEIDYKQALAQFYPQEAASLINSRTAQTDLARLQQAMMLHNATIGGLGGGFGANRLAGKNVLNTTTGEAVAVPGNAAMNSTQRALIAEKIVMPQLKTIAAGITPYLTAEGKIKQGADIARNFIGAHTPESEKRFSEYKNAKATIARVAESLMNAWQLPKTNMAVALILNALEPAIGDTENTYTSRIKSTIDSLKNNEAIFQDIQKSGIPLEGSLTPGSPMNIGFGAMKYPTMPSTLTPEQAKQMMIGAGYGNNIQEVSNSAPSQDQGVRTYNPATGRIE